jgi:hypothetical protein
MTHTMLEFRWFADNSRRASKTRTARLEAPRRTLEEAEEF